MNDLGVIFQAEFLRKVRSRPFIIGTIFGAIGLILISLLPTLLEKSFSGSNKGIILAGEPALVAQAKSLVEKDFDVIATLPKPTVPPTLADLDAHQKANSYIILEHDAHGLHAIVYARDPANFPKKFARDLTGLSIATATHLPQTQIKQILEFPVDVKSLDTKFADQNQANAAQNIAQVLVTLLYLAIIVNAQTVMSSVAEEKTNRIAELLVATTSPALLLAGKVLASGVAGFIQVIVWIVSGLYTSRFLMPAPDASAATGSADATGAAAGLSFNVSDISTGIVAAFVIFFLIGFLQYATLYAAGASLITRTEDLGSVAVPLIIPVVAGFFLAQFAMTSPNTPAIAIISQIPLLSPFVMFARLAVSTVPPWQLILAVAINIVALWAIVTAAGRIYRVGLLMYGRLPSIGQVIAALRA